MLGQAQGELAILLLSGSDSTAEIEKRAIELLRLASEAGDVKASYNLGVLHAEGRAGLAQAKAHDLIRGAAEKGYPEAQNALSVWYEHGSTNVRQDARKAAQWGRKAAENGHVAAMHNLGLRLLRGDGVSVNEKEAISWFEKAADTGELESLVALGNLLVNRDDKKDALQCFLKAAEEGHFGAMFNTAVCYDAGLGTDP